MFQLPSYFPQFVNTVFMYIQQALIFLPTTKMPRECVAVGCTELQTKGSLFSFHTFPTDSCRRKLQPWRFELQIVPSQLPCGHPHRHELFTKGITHHPAFARLNSEIHFDTLAPSAKIKIKIGGKPPSQETLQKMKGKSTKEETVHTNPQEEWTHNKCRRRKRRRRREKKKTKQNKKTNGHGKHGEKKGKTGGTTPELPTNTPASSKINENNQDKSKSQKVNRNLAGLCTF